MIIPNAKKRHSSFECIRKIGVIDSYEIPLDLPKSNGRRVETVKHLVSCIRHGGLHLGIGLRTFAGIAAYALVGSWYRVFSKAKSASND